MSSSDKSLLSKNCISGYVVSGTLLPPCSSFPPVPECGEGSRIELFCKLKTNGLQCQDIHEPLMLIHPLRVRGVIAK